MKKYIAVILMVIFSVFCIGCSSDSKLDELETRIEKLEKTISEGLKTNEKKELSTVEEKNTMTGIYSPDFFSGYKFYDDGTVLFYNAKWYKAKNKPTGCKPEYCYGTYSIDGPALTIKLSGKESDVTGVLKDGQIIIDGKSCELITESYAKGIKSDLKTYEESAVKQVLKEWNGLNEKLGLELVTLD